MERTGPSYRDLWEEERKVRELCILADLVASLLGGEHLSLFESVLLLKAARKFALRRFPDKEETYELIYASRFRRLLGERMRSCGWMN